MYQLEKHHILLILPVIKCNIVLTFSVGKCIKLAAHVHMVEMSLCNHNPEMMEVCDKCEIIYFMDGEPDMS